MFYNYSQLMKTRKTRGFNKEFEVASSSQHHAPWVTIKTALYSHPFWFEATRGWVCLVFTPNRQVAGPSDLSRSL